MTKRTKSNLKDIAVRAGKTFLQAFIAALSVPSFTDYNTVKAAILAAIAAGVSASWNSLLVANQYRK